MKRKTYWEYQDMYTNGWTKDELELAMVRTFIRYHNNMEFANRYLKFRSNDHICYNVRIKPIRSSRLLVRDRVTRDCMYRPGVLIRPTMNGGERSCGAACWHAYGYFLRSLFDMNNNGWIKTREAKYLGLKGFLESTARRAASRSAGGMLNYCVYEDMCLCYEYELTEF